MLSREINIQVEEKTEADVEKAVREVFRLIRDSDMGGSDGTAKYSYNFDVQDSGEEELEEDDEGEGYGDEDSA